MNYRKRMLRIKEEVDKFHIPNEKFKIKIN